MVPEPRCNPSPPIGRVLLDTCILNIIFEEGEYLWEGVVPSGYEQREVPQDLNALRTIFEFDKRANFQLLVSPISIAEVANIQDFADRNRRLGYILEVLDHWCTLIDEIEDRHAQGGTVRHRFKLTKPLQEFECQLMQIAEFRRDPLDRLLLIQYRMADCDAFITVDVNTIWRHRSELELLDIRVLRPHEWWDNLKPWARLWY